MVVDNLPENQCCKDITIAQQIQTLKPGSNKIPVVLRNLSCRTLKVRKGMKIAHVEASNIVPMMVNQRLSEECTQEGSWKCSQKAPYSRTYPMQKKKD